MFGLFKKKTEVEKLQDKYEKLINEAHKLSTIDRKASDLKTYEADQVLKKIDELSAKV
ncbi:MAG: Lacal_2735 family protein [Bacteroidota bacterium]